MNSDRNLVKRLQNNDEAAFDVIYHKYVRLLFHIIFSILENRDDSNDIIQETFMSIIENINSFDPKKNFKSWIIRIAKNKALDFIRKQKRIDRSVSLEEVEAQRDLMREKSDFELMMNQYRDLINKDEFNIITLRIFHKLKFTEIASIYEKSVSAVNNIYFRGINKIKEKYRRFEEHEKVDPKVIY